MKRHHSYTIIGGAISALMIALIVLAMFWTPYDPTALSVGPKLDAPSLAHLMGTDNLGRDIFSRVFEGAGTTLTIAVMTVAIGALCGILIGSFTGYYGGPIDLIFMRICDTVTAFPSFLLALVIVSVLGPGKYHVVIALGILFIPSFARIVRGEYARAVTPYLPELGVPILTCLFGDARGGRLVQRSTEAKASRGTFVRWCAETGVARADELASFCERGYALDEGLSSAGTLVFVRERG